MPAPPKKTTRGLASINQAREDRSRGKSRWTTSAGLTALSVIVCGGIAYKVMSERDLNSRKSDLAAKERAVEQTLGAEWFPLRDKLEARVLEASKEFRGDQVDPEALTWDFRSMPGIYLRLRKADVVDAAALRKLAVDAKKDAFATCLLREPNERLAKGEADAGAFPEQPWNLGQAYSSTRILNPDWINELKDAPDDLHLRVFEQQFQKAVREEIPLAVDVIKRAQFFLFVLDEDVPEANAKTDGGGITSDALQQVPHPARIHLVNLKTDKEVLRLRRIGSAQVMQAGEHSVSDPDLRAAMQRQVNNCSLARRVQAELTPAPVDAGAAQDANAPRDAAKTNP